MTLQKWIEDRAIHGFPTFSVEDVRAADLCSSEQILQNELSRLCSNKTIAREGRKLVEKKSNDLIASVIDFCIFA